MREPSRPPVRRWTSIISRSMAPVGRMPAGWYPDPISGHLPYALRFWDERGWGEHVRWWDGLGWRHAHTRYAAFNAWIFRLPSWMSSLAGAFGAIVGLILGTTGYWLVRTLEGQHTIVNPIANSAGALIGAALVTPFLLWRATRLRHRYGWPVRPPSYLPGEPRK
jgi:uncharacterized membrane protein YeaQ/YmgE (transglycosylase-associated protein family)